MGMIIQQNKRFNIFIIKGDLNRGSYRSSTQEFTPLKLKWIMDRGEAFCEMNSRATEGND